MAALEGDARSEILQVKTNIHLDLLSFFFGSSSQLETWEIRLTEFLREELGFPFYQF